MTDELPAALHARITALCEAGDAAGDAGDHAAALRRYGEAWASLPSPPERWAAAVWIVSSIGDVRLARGETGPALAAFTDALAWDGPGNPYLHLRRGQCLLDLGEPDGAADELCRAYMGGGEELFEGDDPRYFAFLRTRIAPPPGGWPGDSIMQSDPDASERPGR